MTGKENVFAYKYSAAAGTVAYCPAAGFSLAYLMAAIACLLMLSLAAVSYLLPTLKNNDRLTRITHTDRLVRQSAYLLAAAASDIDSDDVAEPPAFLSGTFKPTGGGNVPSVNNAPQKDAWGHLLGYCPWDNGATNSSTHRITGTTWDGNSDSQLNIPSLAVISAGPDGIFETTCSNLHAGTIKGDDRAVILNVQQVKAINNGGAYFNDSVADATALNALSTAGLADGTIRLQRSDNTLWHWNSGNNAWQQVATTPGPVPPQRNRNLIINGNFDIWQRGTSFSVGTSNKYTADRWGGDVSGTSATYSQAAVNPTDTNAPQNATYALQLAPSAGTTYWELYQAIENLRQFSNQTLTISFYARNTLYNASTNYTDFTVTLVSAFGSGGSSWVYTTDGKTYTPTATWTHYTITQTVPDMSGQTFGTTGTDMLELVFAENMNTGTPNLQFAQFQVERGSTATPFEVRPRGYEMLLCQRYFESHDNSASGIWENQQSAYMLANTSFRRSFMFKVEKRKAPTIKIISSSYAGMTGAPGISASTQGFREVWTADSTTGIKTMATNWTADADF